MNEFGVHGLALSADWKPSRAAEYRDRLGPHEIDLVEIPLLKPDALDPKEARVALEQAGLRAHFSLVLPAFLDLVERPGEAVDFMRLILDTADTAGSKVVTGVTYSKIGGMTPEQPSGRELDAVCRFLDRAGAHAKSKGMRLGVEAVNRYETKLINTARQARDVIERTGSDGLMVHLDTYHMNIEEDGFASAFEEAGELLGYVHLSESNRGVPGKGTVDWVSCFKEMAAIGYEGPIVLESFVCMVEELAGGLCIWRPVADNPDDVIDAGIPFIKDAASEAGYAP